MYKFDKKGLTFVKVSWPEHLWKYVMGVIIMIAMYAIIIPLDRNMKIQSEAKVIIAKQNQFSEEKLKELIYKLNFKFPDIVLAQAIHESNNFKSPLFIENNNMFGMKPAVVRISTSKGNHNGYAYYDTWTESVYDYALYAATYLSNIQTKDEYYSYLSQNYAEDSLYVIKIKALIKTP